MPDITVHRHGDRWAVLEAGAESPVKEFPTREAAELAARQMAGGGAVDVVEDDPTDLGPVEDPQATAGDPAERSRQPQTGL
jgi:Uncharacterized protein conserved in bacteria (DUF2188)